MKNSKTMFGLISMFAIAFLMPDMAAAGAGALAETLCSAVDFITDGVGAAIATIAIIVIGVGALMGKVSWGMAIIVALGIAIIFGAGEIAESLGAENNVC